MMVSQSDTDAKDEVGEVKESKQGKGRHGIKIPGLGALP